MEFNKHNKSPRLYIDFSGQFFFVFLAIIFLLSTVAAAGPVEKKQAEKMVRGWLKTDAKPFGCSPGRNIKKTETFYNEDSEPIYYVIYFQSNGFVIVPADDRVEPIICFAAGQAYNPSEDNPLGALVSRDIPGRIASVRELETAASESKTGNRARRRRAGIKARDKWNLLNSYSDASDPMMGALGASGISDVWVAPLVQSTWGQTTVGNYIGGTSCYNYYTPPYYTPDGDPNNYPCGCIATAMAQIMRYREYPGAYVWSNMPLEPDDDITLTERQAIGEICYDAAESIDTVYGPIEDGGSIAYFWKVRNALPGTFGYSNAIDGWNNNNNIGAGLNGMVNPNLDAGYPVLLGLRGEYGHGVVADGYGYNSLTLYHHLNMGWSGTDDAWYNLPDVDCDPPFDSVEECIYNIFTSGTGEIISGRVTDLSGQPISGVNITATGSGGPFYATTNEKGIYAVVNVRSNRSYTLSAEKGSWSFSNQPVGTGKSENQKPTSGNLWGVNFDGTISAGFIEFDRENYTVPEMVIVRVVDTDLQGDGSVVVVVKTCSGDYETLTLTEQPTSSGVFSSSVSAVQGAVVTEDGTIQVDGSNIAIGIYQDSDDGTGNQVTSRDTAAISCSVTVLDEQFSSGIPGTWTVVDGGTSSDTWEPGNASVWQSRDYWDGTLTGDFVVVDSDGAYNEDMDEQLITPVLDCSSYDDVQLSFKHWFVYYPYGNLEIADVDVRVDGGQWQNIARYEDYDSGVVELDISSLAAGYSNVQIRWHYYNANWDYYWGVDEAEVTAIGSAQLPTGDFEPDCDVDFDDFAVLGSAWRTSTGEGNYNPACDISEPNDGIINEFDLEALAENWLASTP